MEQVVEILLIHGARTSAKMTSNKISWNNKFAAPEELNHLLHLILDDVLFYMNARADTYYLIMAYPDSKVRGANMGPIWGRQDPGGPHVGPMNLAIWVVTPRGDIDLRGFRAFPGKHLECSCIMTTLRAGSILITVCWFS